MRGKIAVMQGGEIKKQNAGEPRADAAVSFPDETAGYRRNIKTILPEKRKEPRMAGEFFTEREKALLGAQYESRYAVTAPLYRGVTVNGLRCPPERFLRHAGLALAPSPFCAQAFLLTDPEQRLGRHAYHHAGVFYAQEPSAAMPAGLLDVRPGERVLDLCAAPGGKSFAAAMAMEDRGEVIACDIHPHKLALIEKGAARLGLGCVRAELADGRERREAWAGAFDLVLCDVPCSGLGVIRKKPDIRYKDPAALAGLPRVQRAILENAAAYVRPGGALLYATCTVLPEENEDVAEDFLARHGEFQKEPFSLPGLEEENDGAMRLWPQRHGTDGFYVCKMRKR